MGSLVSIVIPTRNSAATLPLTLRSIERQTYSDIEVIVVDNRSSDGTVEIARRFGARVYSYGPERSAQKNYGALRARGRYVYFIDSDFVLHPRVVEESVQLLESGSDAVVVLNISDPRPSIVARARFYERLSYYGSNTYEAARFMKKSLFLRVGGFDPHLYANEDLDLHQRLLRHGARIAWTRRSFEIHLGEPRSVREYVVKSLYYGSSIGRYFRKNPNPLHMTPLRPTFFRRWFLAYMARRWPQGVLLVPLFKVLQAAAMQLGRMLPLRVSPYEGKS